MTGQQLYKLLFHVNIYHGNLCGYAELAESIKFRHWQGHGKDPEYIEEIVPAGTTVKIVMASRFGDLGITKNLEVDHGYQCRVEPSLLVNGRLQQSDLLAIMEQGWDWELKTWSTGSKESSNGT